MPVILFGPLGPFYAYVRVNKIIAIPCMNISAYTLFIPMIVLFGQLMAGFFPLIPHNPCITANLRYSRNRIILDYDNNLVFGNCGYDPI